MVRTRLSLLVMFQMLAPLPLWLLMKQEQVVPLVERELLVTEKWIQGLSVLRVPMLTLLVKMLTLELPAALEPFQYHLMIARMTHSAVLMALQDSHLPLMALLMLVALLLMSHALGAMKSILHALEWELLQPLRLHLLVAQGKLDSQVKLM